MNIIYNSVFVNNQNQALEFYTKILGFVKKRDVPVGQFRWLTVVEPNNLNGTELLLEPNDNLTARRYQKELFAQNIPATSFGIKNIHAEYERLKALGVGFSMTPTKMGEVVVAVFDDTCGNLIQIMQR